jgi:hypothetical protein
MYKIMIHSTQGATERTVNTDEELRALVTEASRLPDALNACQLTVLKKRRGGGWAMFLSICVSHEAVELGKKFRLQEKARG